MEPKTKPTTKFYLWSPEKSIFYSKTTAVVNPVNCDGIMGKGLAAEFKKVYGPEYFEEYVSACRSHMIKPGKVCAYFSDKDWLPRVVFNFATKDRWRDPSSLSMISMGLISLSSSMKNLDISSISVPKLGCGLGGLKWEEVLPLIEKHLNADHIETVEIYTT